MPSFRAGQGVALRLEGFESRAYTRCSSPDEGCRITIKVLDNDRGALSAELTQSLHVGDEIEVSEPGGGFVLDDRETPVVMIAEGNRHHLDGCDAFRNCHRSSASPRASHLFDEKQRSFPASGRNEESRQADS